MKKQLFNALLCCFLAIPFISSWADTVVDGQSTEGKDFWVTFMQADQNDVSDTMLARKSHCNYPFLLKKPVL